MVRNPSIAEMRDALNDVDFPLAKEELVTCVTTAGVDAAVVNQIRALPLAEYASVDEVLRSIEVADTTG